MGLFYVQHLQALVKTEADTDCMSTLGVPTGTVSTQLDTLEVVGPGVAGFQARTTLPALNAQVGTIIGNAESLVKVSQNVEMYWATRVGVQNKLTIDTNVYVEYGGKIDLPKTVVIDKGWSLDVCGTVTTSTDEMTVRENGELRMSYPASDFEIHTLVIDYQGVLTASQFCDTTGNRVNLRLTYFNKTSSFNLDTNKFSLSAGTQGTVSPSGSALQQTACATTLKLELKRDQWCNLATGSHQYNSIIIHPGAEIRITGSETGSGTTTISANNIDIKFGGKITGVGKGFKTGGPGSAASSSEGATHAGTGHGNTKATYGNIMTPNKYGSNGNGASSSSGRGGGQVKLDVSNTLTVDGTIDMSADSGNGGSGGSIWVIAATITGDGYMKAEGSNGGGGGRIAADASNTYSFTGTLSTNGGEDTSGNKGSSGTAYSNSGLFPYSDNCFHLALVHSLKLCRSVLTVRYRS